MKGFLLSGFILSLFTSFLVSAQPGLFGDKAHRPDFNKLQTALHLSESQSQQIKNIIAESKEKMKSLKEKGIPDNEKKSAAKDIWKQQRQKIGTVLNPAQKATFHKMVEHRQDRMHKAQGPRRPHLSPEKKALLLEKRKSFDEVLSVQDKNQLIALRAEKKEVREKVKSMHKEGDSPRSKSEETKKLLQAKHQEWIAKTNAIAAKYPEDIAKLKGDLLPLIAEPSEMDNSYKKRYPAKEKIKFRDPARAAERAIHHFLLMDTKAINGK